VGSAVVVVSVVAPMRKSPPTPRYAPCRPPPESCACARQQIFPRQRPPPNENCSSKGPSRKVSAALGNQEIARNPAPAAGDRDHPAALSKRQGVKSIRDLEREAGAKFPATRTAKVRRASRAGSREAGTHSPIAKPTSEPSCRAERKTRCPYQVPGWVGNPPSNGPSLLEHRPALARPELDRPAHARDGAPSPGRIPLSRNPTRNGSSGRSRGRSDGPTDPVSVTAGPPVIDANRSAVDPAMAPGSRRGGVADSGSGGYGRGGRGGKSRPSGPPTGGGYGRPGSGNRFDSGSGTRGWGTTSPRSGPSDRLSGRPGTEPTGRENGYGRSSGSAWSRNDGSRRAGGSRRSEPRMSRPGIRAGSRPNNRPSGRPGSRKSGGDSLTRALRTGSSQIAQSETAFVRVGPSLIC